MMDEINRILFIELLGGIGDVAIALSAIHALGRSYPHSRLTVLTFAPGGELLETDPFIHRVIYARQGKAREAVEGLLAQETFDLIVSDTNYDGIAEIVSNAGARQVVTNLWQSPPSDELVGDRFLNILLSKRLINGDPLDNEPQLHLTATEKAIARQALGASYRPLIFLIPDAGMSIKRWPTLNFIDLGKQLQQKYGATIIIPVGSDRQQAQQITEAIGGTARIWPRDSLRNVASVIAEADLVVAADTGLARIAAALNVATITLFGPSWYGRYGQPSPHINLQGFPQCSERNISNFTEQHCWYSGQCPFEWDTCLEDISPAQVLEAAISLFTPSSPPPLTSSSRPLTPSSPPPLTPSSFDPVWQTVRNLLVMRLDNIGDAIMTSPALRALRENLPNAKITLMASPAGTQVAPLLPWIDEVLTWRVLWQDLGRLDFNPEREWQLIETLKHSHFDAAIVFTSFRQSPHPPAFICALAGIPLRLGESKEKDTGTLTHFISAAPDEIHQVERNLRLIESVGFHVSDRRLTLHIPSPPHPLIPSPPHPLTLSYILLNPWTSCPSRTYDSHRFAVAARQLSKITGWPVVVTGVAKDKNCAHSLLDTLGSCAIDTIGKTNLSELVALVAGAKLVLTNNTSVMHIADATDTPSVVLFAGTERESQWQPRDSSACLLRRPTVCSPCYAFTCPYEMQCLDISAEAVVTAGLQVLEQIKIKT